MPDSRAAAKFYAKYGFTPLLDDPRHMYLPIGAAEQAVSAADEKRKRN